MVNNMYKCMHAKYFCGDNIKICQQMSRHSHAHNIFRDICCISKFGDMLTTFLAQWLHKHSFPGHLCVVYVNLHWNHTFNTVLESSIFIEIVCIIIGVCPLEIPSNSINFNKLNRGKHDYYNHENQNYTMLNL